MFYYRRCQEVNLFLEGKSPLYPPQNQPFLIPFLTPYQLLGEGRFRGFGGYETLRVCSAFAPLEFKQYY